MPEHYRMSPSAMDRILYCPGSAREDLPDESNEAADRGTLGHSHVHAAFGGPLPEAPLTEDLVEPVLECIEYVRGLPFRFTRYHEQTIVHQSIADFGGTCDVVLLYDDEALEVVDFKFGEYPVSIHDNKQLLSYLLLARDRFGAAKTYAYHVLQPALEVFARVDVPVEQLNRHALDVLRASADSSLHAGAHCRWCPLAMRCEARREWTRGIGATVFDEKTTIETYLEVLQAAPVLAKLEEDAKKELLKLALAGHAVPGYRVGKSLTNWLWKDEEQVAETFDGYAYEQVLRSPTSMAEAYHENHGGTKKAAREFVNTFCERRVKGPIITPEDSKVPDWDYVTAEVFDG